MLQSLVELAFGGLAFGAVLFLISSGLSISMGLMRFANLAHGASVMFGGYAAVTLIGFGVPYLLTLPAAFLLCFLLGLVVELVLLRHFYARPETSQLLVTIGLVFISLSVALHVWGAGQHPIDLPAALNGRIPLGSGDISAYRVFVSGVGVALAIALIATFERSSLGARVRAAVDDRQMAQSCGVNVARLFTLVFALSSGIAGIGGALAVNLLGLDPSFPLRYLVIILIVVAVGGPGSIRATLGAALLIGVIDSATKYFLPAYGSFAIYAFAALALYARPEGLFVKARA